MTPVFLATADGQNATQRKAVIDEISRFSLQEKRTLKQMQDNGCGDVATQAAMADIMEEFQFYASKIKEGLKSAGNMVSNSRDVLKTPLILTPWSHLNAALTKQTLFDVFGESSLQWSKIIENSTRFKSIDLLYEKMYERSVLADQLQQLPKNRTLHVKSTQSRLFARIKELEKDIKTLLPKKIKTKSEKYLQSIFTEREIKNIRRSVVNQRTAGKVKTFTLNLDLLNKTGLNRLRSLITELKFLGEGINKGAMYLNYGVVGYDTVQAIRNNGNIPKTFITGVLSVAATTEIVAAAGGTSALGAMVIGGIAGDAAIGTTLLLCCPWVGWAVVLVGVAASAYVSYKVTESFEGVWDLAEDKDGKVKENAKNAIGWMYDQFHSAWKSGASWLSSYYGHSK